MKISGSLARRSRLHIRVLQGFLSSTDTANASWRRSIGVAGTPPESVVQVTDDRICSRAARAADRVARKAGRDEPVYVYRYGPLYAVADPDEGKHYSFIWLFDRAFHHKGQIGY